MCHQRLGFILENPKMNRDSQRMPLLLLCFAYPKKKSGLDLAIVEADDVDGVADQGIVGQAQRVNFHQGPPGYRGRGEVEVRPHIARGRRQAAHDGRLRVSPSWPVDQEDVAERSST